MSRVKYYKSKSSIAADLCHSLLLLGDKVYEIIKVKYNPYLNICEIANGWKCSLRIDEGGGRCGHMIEGFFDCLNNGNLDDRSICFFLESLEKGVESDYRVRLGNELTVSLFLLSLIKKYGYLITKDKEGNFKKWIDIL